MDYFKKETVSPIGPGQNNSDNMALNGLISSGYEALCNTARQLIMDKFEDVSLLIHETYLRFILYGRIRFADKNQFFRLFCHTMRKIHQERISDGLGHGPLEWASQEPTHSHADPSRALIIGLAMTAMAEATPGQYKVVYLRFYLGQSKKEIAETLAVSEATVKRLWRKARKQLAHALRNADSDLVWRTKNQPLQLDLHPKPLPPITN